MPIRPVQAAAVPEHRPEQSALVQHVPPALQAPPQQRPPEHMVPSARLVQLVDETALLHAWQALAGLAAPLA